MTPRYFLAHAVPTRWSNQIPTRSREVPDC